MSGKRSMFSPVEESGLLLVIPAGVLPATNPSLTGVVQWDRLSMSSNDLGGREQCCEEL
ncbi:hypothetical protein BVI2075_990005 [Burkholderia vietnamiensis]|nr:hypothetical protein BVI2075_990005 [Burkholderia vietnamiensis]